MELYFKLSDWLRTIQGDGWHQQEIRDKKLVDDILKYHLVPMNEIRSELGLPMKVNSGYRSEQYERSKGRSGNSQHCFKPISYDGIGATDIDVWYDKDSTIDNYKDILKLLDKSDYKRIAWYPGATFFHCDYDSVGKQYFIQENGSWNYISSNIQDLIDRMN